MDITFQKGDGGMVLQERQTSILINKAGGTAGLEGKSYRIVLSPVRTKQLGIRENNCEILLQFVGKCITIRRAGTERSMQLFSRKQETKSMTC